MCTGGHILKPNKSLVIPIQDQRKEAHYVGHLTAEEDTLDQQRWQLFL